VAETKSFYLPLLVVAIAIGTFVALMFFYGQDEATVPEEETFIITAFQDGDWEIPDGWRLFADEEEIGRRPALLIYHDNNWTSFPGELRNDTGPWAYSCILWYNTETNQTYIQKDGAVKPE